jgi:hypothetical protein
VGSRIEKGRFVVRKKLSFFSKNRVVKFKDIWEGKGFERIDAEKEIRKVRKELAQNILSRGSSPARFAKPLWPRRLPFGY